MSYPNPVNPFQSTDNIYTFIHTSNSFLAYMLDIIHTWK